MANQPISTAADQAGSQPAHGLKPQLPVELTLEAYERATPAMQRHMLTQLVTQIYGAAPPTFKRLLLDRLIRPLGLLSLVTVANGIFARLRLRGGWPHLQARVEDLQNIQLSDVAALADRAQLVSRSALAQLASLIAASPVLAGSAAATLLVMLVLRSAAAAKASGDLDA